MIIIKMLGGLGNQMFTLALMIKLQNLNKDVKLDMQDIDEYLSEHGWDDATKVFNIKYYEAEKKEISEYYIDGEDINKKIFRKIRKLQKKYYVEDTTGNYDKKIFSFDNIYLMGYWQSYKYFEEIKKKIIYAFSFPIPTSKDNVLCMDKIRQSTNSISIHIRLGDYLEGINREIYGGICTEEYYDAAISYFENKYGNCTFFLFSNDKDYIKKFLDRENFFIVDCNNEKNAWADMYLMTQCNHNIIANSSFSWWGAWLNQHKNKEVVAPKKWINTKEMKDICPPEWIRL